MNELCHSYSRRFQQHLAERSLFLGIARMMWAFDVLLAKNENGNEIRPDAERLTPGFIFMPEPFQATIRARSEKRASIVRQAWAEAQKDLDPKTGEWKFRPQNKLKRSPHCKQLFARCFVEL